MKKADFEKKFKELEKSCRKLEELSVLDELTGLFNRRGFMTLANQQLAIAKRRKEQFLIFFIDLDNMKNINDSYGHKEGDYALIETAKIIRKTFRESDFAGRWGGDEFAVMAIDSSIKEFDGIMKRLFKAMEKQNLSSGKPYKLSFSVGAASYPEGRYHSIDDMLEKADIDLYRKKRHKKIQGEASVLPLPLSPDK
jgi:diguanylate cyclase (GGDEF)-like protein